jgi:Fe-Mn family superoxide dismutase
MCKAFSLICGVLLLGLAPLLGHENEIAQTPKNDLQKVSLDYQAKDYSSLLGMHGFTDAQLKMHFQAYEGYVKNCNLILNRLRDMALSGKSTAYEWGTLKIRLGWEFDGMRLHELYFENLGAKEPLDKNSALYQRIVKDFGSFDQWKKDFVATGMIRGIGWSILYRDPQNGRLINTWIDEHDLGHIAGGAPLLAMDVFEHAYITVYGLDREKYITAFFDNINWKEVSRRFDASSSPAR